MSLPDILIPSNAKYINFLDDKNQFNPHFDITWSFTIALTGTEHGFSTFLSNSKTFLPNLGHYLGLPLEDENLITENYINILTESNDNIAIYDSLSSVILSICFDTTGYTALSTPFISGLRYGDIKKNSITIRDDNREIVYHDALSSLDTEFMMTSSKKYWQTLRFKFCNVGTKLEIDLKTTDAYKTILSLPVHIKMDLNSPIYPGFSFMSPISSNSIFPSTLFLKNFHTQGSTKSPTYEIIEPTDFIIDTNTEYNIFTSADKIIFKQ